MTEHADAGLEFETLGEMGEVEAARLRGRGLGQGIALAVDGLVGDSTAAAARGVELHGGELHGGELQGVDVHGLPVIRFDARDRQ